jgi:hypothetical protein
MGVGKMKKEVSFEQKSTVKEIEELLKKRTTENYRGEKLEFRNSTIKKIEVSEHAYSRWNKRVGPVTEKVVVEQVIDILLETFRVEWGENGIGYLDDEIVFTFDYLDESTVVIKNFYGRISAMPALQDFEELREYNQTENEKVDLSLSDEELKKQRFPILPVAIEQHIKKRFKHQIEYFETENQQKYKIIMCHENGRRCNTKMIKE